ncbi:TPA: ATP phosphoribosyltransferase regulatory subunit [Streptococcus pneumoniae]|nr:ATP phosphoribosyltransferase regulatory subunit [Streptococcus pneumoniae]
MVRNGNIKLDYPKGFFDLDEMQFKKYCDIENHLRSIASINGFELIKVSSAVYSRLNEYTHASIGRYYQVKDEKNRNIGLSSDGSMSILRYFYNNKQGYSSYKVCSNATIYRKNKKLREFSQFCYEIFNASSIDELQFNYINLILEILDSLELESVVILTNFNIWKIILSRYNNYKDILYELRKSKDILGMINSLNIDPSYVKFLSKFHKRNFTIYDLLNYCRVHKLFELIDELCQMQKYIEYIQHRITFQINLFDFRGSEIFEGIYYKCVDKYERPFLDAGTYSNLIFEVTKKNILSGGLAVCIEAILDRIHISQKPKKVFVKYVGGENFKIDDFYNILTLIRKEKLKNHFVKEEVSSLAIAKAKRRAYIQKYDLFIAIGEREKNSHEFMIEELKTGLRRILILNGG